LLEDTVLDVVILEDAELVEADATAEILIEDVEVVDAMVEVEVEVS